MLLSAFYLDEVAVIFLTYEKTVVHCCGWGGVLVCVYTSTLFISFFLLLLLHLRSFFLSFFTSLIFSFPEFKVHGVIQITYSRLLCSRGVAIITDRLGQQTCFWWQNNKQQHIIPSMFPPSLTSSIFFSVLSHINDFFLPRIQISWYRTHYMLPPV